MGQVPKMLPYVCSLPWGTEGRRAARAKVARTLSALATDTSNLLKRAIGLDTHIVVDFIDGKCELGDAFLLVSDGVWDTLGESRMKSLFEGAADPQSAADVLVNAACGLQANYLGRNDASAIVASVLPLPR